MAVERADDSMKFQLPQELLAEVSRSSQPKKAEFYRVEAFKPSLFGRVAEFFGGKRR